MVPSGEVTGSPFPQTQNILTTRENYLFFEELLSSLFFHLPRLIFADSFTPFLLPHERKPLNYVPVK
jgi:hypothetical protein